MYNVVCWNLIFLVLEDYLEEDFIIDENFCMYLGNERIIYCIMERYRFRVLKFSNKFNGVFDCYVNVSFFLMKEILKCRE